MKIYLPPDIPEKIAKLSPQAQIVAKRLVRAKLRRVRRAIAAEHVPQGNSQSSTATINSFQAKERQTQEHNAIPAAEDHAL